MQPSRVHDSMPELKDRQPASRVTGGGDYELFEEGDQLVLSIEMPGFDREDIAMSWDDGLLFVAAEHEGERRRSRSFRRRFKLSDDIEPDEIEARYRNGILAVHLPNPSLASRGTEIEISSE